MAAEELLSAAAGSASKGAIDSVVSAADASRKDRIWREHQDILFSQQMESQRRSIPNLVASYRAAGLNPALAAGGSAMNISSAAPPGGADPSAGEMNPEFGKIGDERSLLRRQNSLLQTQENVNNSQVDKNIADTNKSNEEAGYYKELAGQLMRGNRDFDEKRFFFSELSMEYLAALREQAVASNDKNRVKVIDNLLDLKDENPDLYFSPALLDAFNLINSGSAANQEHYAKIIRDKLSEMVAAGQLQNSAELNALIHAPTREATAMWKQIAATSKNIELLSQQKSINEADIRKIEAEIIELGKSAERMDAETKKAYSSDVTRMLEDGDYLGAGLELFKYVGNPLGYFFLFNRLRGAVPSNKASAAPSASAASPSKPVVLPVKGTRDPYAPTALVGETKKALDYQKRVSEPFKEQIEINKARGVFNSWYKGYKKEHGGKSHEHR